MVKVADMIGTEPLGRMEVDPAEAQQRAEFLRWLLESDQWEEVKAKAIQTAWDDITAEMKLGLWTYLNSKERSAIKLYLLQAKERHGRHADPI